MKKFLLFVLCIGITGMALGKPPTQDDYINCTAGQVFSCISSTCHDCPSGYTSQSQSNACGICDYNYDTPEWTNCIIENGFCYRDANTALTSGDTCNSDNLGTAANGSTAQTEAVWNANTININWYNGDTRVAQTTCIYDDSITLPTEPTKVGYTFNGWRLKTN